MKYSILHTSHCGSTLLACLLSKSVPTLTEPKWSHQILDQVSILNKIKLLENHKDGYLVKYPSMTYDVYPFLEGKKVFLYREVFDHMKKLGDDSYEYGNRISSILQTNNVLYIETNYFLNNQTKVCQEICDFFGFEYIPVEIDFHVKDAGFNHRNEPIEL